MNLIALQQPLARDLREIAASMKMVTDMERISDQCSDICEIFSSFPANSEMKTPHKIIQMYEKAREMFTGAIDSFLRRDVVLAKQICETDDVVDTLFSRVILDMCGMLPENHFAIPQAVDFMFIAKYIERIADHAANIAEWAVFLETGQHRSLNRDRP